MVVTMSDLAIVRRAWSPLADLEIRNGDDGRTVYGLAVPYDTPTEIRDMQGTYTEVFRMGAFAKTVNEGLERVKFLVNHDRVGRLPLGRAQMLREDPAGLVGEFRVSATREGDEVLELIRDGVLDALSIGFRPQSDKWNKDRTFVERTQAHLLEVSTVAFPAYEGAVIAGVRHEEEEHSGDGAADETADEDGISRHSDDDGAARTLTVHQARARLAQIL